MCNHRRESSQWAKEFHLIWQSSITEIFWICRNLQKLRAKEESISGRKFAWTCIRLCKLLSKLRVKKSNFRPVTKMLIWIHLSELKMICHQISMITVKQRLGTPCPLYPLVLVRKSWIIRSREVYLVWKASPRSDNPNSAKTTPA